jgi:hypothetical protein
MSSDALRPFRETIDAVGTAERPAFARAARNAVAGAILTAALTPGAPAGRPDREPPEAEIRELLGPDLGAELVALYRGGDDWTSRAIDLLGPLNELAHTERR